MRGDKHAVAPLALMSTAIVVLTPLGRDYRWSPMPPRAVAYARVLAKASGSIRAICRRRVLKLFGERRSVHYQALYRQ